MDYFAFPAHLSCISHSIDIFIAAIKNVSDMNSVSTNQCTAIFHFDNTPRTRETRELFQVFFVGIYKPHCKKASKQKPLRRASPLIKINKGLIILY